MVMQDAYKCRIKLPVTLLILGDALGPVALMTLSVNCGSKRDVFAVDVVPLVADILTGTLGGTCKDV